MTFAWSLFLWAIPIKNNTDGALASGILSIIYGSNSTSSSFQQHTCHSNTLGVWEPIVLTLLGSKTAGGGSADLVIITSKSMLFLGLNDLMETKVLKKLNNTKLALVMSLKP